MSISLRNTKTSTIIDPDRLYYFPIQFGMFVFLLILNIPSSISYLYYSFAHATYRKALYNYSTVIFIVINLFYQLTCGVFYIYYFHNFDELSQTREFRLFWGFIDWSFLMLQLLLFAWTSIERHILIFHDQFIATKIKRLFFHHLPPVVIIIYDLFYYILIIFTPNCENIDPESPNPTFDPCAFQNGALHTYETIVHQIAPVFIIVISSVILLLRVLWQKYRVHQRIRWRQNRRMAVQLLAVSFLYLTLPTPYILVFLLNICGLAKTYAADITKYYLYLGYYALLLHPVVCVATSPGLTKKIRKFFRKNTIVHPARIQRLIGANT